MSVAEISPPSPTKHLATVRRHYGGRMKTDEIMGLVERIQQDIDQSKGVKCDMIESCLLSLSIGALERIREAGGLGALEAHDALTVIDHFIGEKPITESD